MHVSAIMACMTAVPLSGVFKCLKTPGSCFIVAQESEKPNFADYLYFSKDDAWASQKITKDPNSSTWANSIHSRRSNEAIIYKTKITQQAGASLLESEFTDSVKFHMEKSWSSLVQMGYSTKVQWLPFRLTCQYNLYKCLVCTGGQHKISGTMYCFKGTPFFENQDQFVSSQSLVDLFNFHINKSYISIKIGVIL